MIGFKEPVQVATVPPMPKAGAAVADELDRVCPVAVSDSGQKQSTCPAIDVWLNRLYKFRQQLEVVE